MENVVIQRTWIHGERVKIDDLRSPEFAFQGENAAHTFIIDGKTEQGVAVNITGEIKGVYLGQNNVSVPLVGELENGKAVLTLDAPCYAAPGRFILSIYAETNGMNICIYCGIGYMFRTESDRLAYPSRAIPDILGLIDEAQDLIAYIEQARVDIPNEIEAKGQEVLASIPSDYTELSNDVSALESLVVIATVEETQEFLGLT